ncbi:MAG: hypothetical protein AAGF46_07495 [Pseudomonadota bacterium]
MLRNTLAVVLTTTLLLFSAQLFAQDKFLRLQDAQNNEADPCALVADASLVINPVSGDVDVTVADLEDCLGTTDALNVSPILLEPTPVVAGSALQVLWASVGAISCQPDTVGPNVIPGWSDETLGLQGPVTFFVSGTATAGIYNVGVTCTDGELSVTQSASIQVNEPDPGDPPPAPTLTLNGTPGTISINPGDSLTIAWNSTDATACQANGTLPGWSGAQNTSGSESITTSGLPVGSSYMVQLSCSNLAGTSPTTSRTLNVVDPGSGLPAGCETRPLLGFGALSDWVQKTTGANSCVWDRLAGTVVASADCRFVDQVWPNPWPGSQNTRNLTIFGNSGKQFISMAFNSGNIPTNHEGRMTQEVPQFAGANGGLKLWSISKCPGDYNADILETEMGPGCVWREFGSLTESFRWGGPGFFNDTTRCALQPNTDYYFNIIWSSDLPGTAPDQIQPFSICVTERCGMNASPAGLYAP